MNEEADAPIEVFGDEAPVEETPAVEASEALSFEADSFSVYAVVVTRTIETRYITDDGETWNISVGYGQDALLPTGATLKVEEVVDADAYLADAKAAVDATRKVTGGRFFDITILDADGNPVQPAVPVTVNVALADDSSDADVSAVHFAEDGAEVIEARREDEEIVFDAASFSVYGIVYTVDFFYDVDGKTFEYHINGGDVLSLKALLPILHVVEEDAAEAFVEDIAEVTFSDETLVKVVPVTEDTTAGEIVDALGVSTEYSGESADGDTDLEAAADAQGQIGRAHV